MILSLENISKIYNGKNVLDNVCLTIEDNDRIGLVGINGCGKSTLLKIITGSEDYESQQEPHVPSLAITKSSSIGYLAQNTGLNKNNTIIEEMTSVFKPLLDIHDEMRNLEQEMSQPDAHNDEENFKRIADEYSKKTAFFEINDGYNINVKIKTVLNGMGFPADTLDKEISVLSGGEKTRLALAKLLLECPSLLILDEPTNHLDFDTIMWLEDYLKDYKGALLLVSHDRYFLDKLCTSVCEIENCRLKRYKGNYSAFTKQKEADTIRQMKEYEAQQAEIAKLQDFVDRNIVRATTSAMAKSRVKKLEAMEIIEKPFISHAQAKLDFEYDIVPPIDILSVRNVDITVGYGQDQKTLVNNVSFDVKRGEKIAVIGSNGIGKSTLLKILMNKLPHLHGTIEWTNNIKISYFDQENSQLNFNNTVIDEIHSRYRTMTDQSIRSLLGRVRMIGENVFKQISVISGGEKAKLCFAIMMLERGNVLILDEPTNHLDLFTKEILEEALDAFDGTIIFVSHDRYLLNKLATKIIEISEHTTTVYNNGFEKYLEIKKQAEAEKNAQLLAEKQENARLVAEENKAKTYKSKEQRANEAKTRARIKEIEKLIENYETEMDQLQTEMTSPDVCADYQLMQDKCKKYEEIKQIHNELTDEWLILCDK